MTDHPNDTRFTPRQLEIVGLIGIGLSNAEIALKLYISLRTTKHHVSDIFAKAGVRNRIELILFAIGKGLITMDKTNG